jgi:hypothetical protein
MVAAISLLSEAPAIKHERTASCQIGWRPVVRLALERAGVGHLLRAGEIHEAERNYLHLNARILAYGEATGADTLMTLEATTRTCTTAVR